MNVCAHVVEPVDPQLDPTLVKLSDDVLAVRVAGAVPGVAVGTGVAVGDAEGTAVGEGVGPGDAVTARQAKGLPRPSRFPRYRCN